MQPGRARGCPGDTLPLPAFSSAAVYPSSFYFFFYFLLFSTEGLGSLEASGASGL